MVETKKPDVIIDLSADRTDGILQRDVMQQLLKLLPVTDSPADMDTFDPWPKISRTPVSLQIDPHHKHRAILLAGRRGEGKTTFLTDLLGRFEQHRFDDIEGIDRTKVPQLHSLGLIDPTMLETKQNIILSVISRIHDVVEHRHRMGDLTGTAGDRSYQDIREAFAKLAQGVTVLDGVGHDLHQGENWADARFIMDHGLTRTEAAYGFITRLKTYIAAAASYLGGKGFLLCIDDVDTRFDIGQKVLEALRKYLTSPHLHIIVSGDPELMLTLVRRLHWQEMGPNYLDFEKSLHAPGARASQIDSVLDQMGSLTDQYLTKILPIERRLRLHPLAELDGVSPTDHRVKLRFNSHEPKPLREVTTRIVARVWGTMPVEDTEHLRLTLLSLPIRSTLEILRASATATGDLSNVDAKRVVEALLQISQSDLRNVDAPPIEALRGSAAAPTFALITGWFSKHRMWQSHGELSNRFADERESRVAVSVSALLADRCRGDLGAILSFWLSFALLQDRAERHGNVPESGAPADKRQLFEFLGMERLEPTYVQMGRLAAWDRGVADKRQVLLGLRLSGIAVPAGRIRNHDEAFRALFGKEWRYSSAAGAKDPRKPLVFFDGKGRSPTLDDQIETFPEEIRPYHQRLKKAQVGGYRYGGTRQYLKRGVYNTIEDLVDGLTGAASDIVRLPYSNVLSGQSSALGNYGFLRLLTVLINVLNAASGAKTAEEARPAVAEALAQSMILYGHPTRFAQEVGIDATEEVVEEEATVSQDNEEGDATFGERADDGGSLVLALAGWALTSQELLHDRTLAPKALLAIWKRFNFAQGRLFQDPVHAGQNRRYLGFMMHRSVVMFLHAVGVEALRSENLPLTSRLQNNPTHSDKLFDELLDDLRRRSDFNKTAGGRLFQSLFTCPIWGFFLKDVPQAQGAATDPVNIRARYLAELPEQSDSEDLFEALFRPAGKDVTPVAFAGLYDLLNTVYIQQ
ncbi:MAG: hypothetical protein MEQ74_06960 [Paracoccus sp.]|nr:hypothetical protein [Paracoccus sp. (in: a-proteobacteria)]